MVSCVSAVTVRDADSAAVRAMSSSGYATGLTIAEARDRFNCGRAEAGRLQRRRRTMLPRGGRPAQRRADTAEG
jgi:hypothetical protein